MDLSREIDNNEKFRIVHQLQPGVFVISTKKIKYDVLQNSADVSNTPQKFQIKEINSTPLEGVDNFEI